MKKVSLLIAIAVASGVTLHGMEKPAEVVVDIEAGGEQSDRLARFYDAEHQVLRGSAGELFGRGIGDIFTRLKDFVVGHRTEQVVITDYSFVHMEREQLEALLGQLVRLQLESPVLKSIKLLEPETGGAPAASRAAGVAGAVLGGLQAELPGLLQALLIKDDDATTQAQKPAVQVIELGGAQVPIILIPQAGSEATVKTIQMGKATVIMLVYPAPPASSRRRAIALAAAGILTNVISAATAAVISQMAR